MNDKQLQDLINDFETRIRKLETEVKLLKSKHPHRSLGKGKNIETPSSEKVVIAN
jgi:hypothetical protein